MPGPSGRVPGWRSGPEQQVNPSLIRPGSQLEQMKISETVRTCSPIEVLLVRPRQTSTEPKITQKWNQPSPPRMMLVVTDTKHQLRSEVNWGLQQQLSSPYFTSTCSSSAVSRGSTEIKAPWPLIFGKIKQLYLIFSLNMFK